MTTETEDQVLDPTDEIIDDETGETLPEMAGMPEEIAAMKLAELEFGEVDEVPPSPAATEPPADEDIYDLIASVTTEMATIDEQRDAVLAEMEALAAQLDDGDIGQGKYDVDLRKLDLKLNKISEKRDTAEQNLSAAEQKQAATANQQQQKFNVAAQAFLDQPENQMFKPDTPEWKSLDDQVRYLQTTQPNLSPEIMLQKARKAVAAIIDLPDAAATPKGKIKRSAPDIPPTLNSIPAVASNNMSDEFAHLDNLTGVEHSRALARMSQADQNRYLLNG